MLEQMTAAEYAGWAAYFEIEPFPETRADIRAAQVVQAIMFTTTGQRFPLDRIVLDWWGNASQAQSPEAIKRTMRTIAAAMTGKFRFITEDNAA